MRRGTEGARRRCDERIPHSSRPPYGNTELELDCLDASASDPLGDAAQGSSLWQSRCSTEDL
jgi:hypothetical protein